MKARDHHWRPVKCHKCVYAYINDTDGLAAKGDSSVGTRGMAAAAAEVDIRHMAAARGMTNNTAEVPPPPVWAVDMMGID